MSEACSGPFTDARDCPVHAPMLRLRHGSTCPKVPHVEAGYLHAADDDGPYDVDGVMYCGRCHLAQHLRAALAEVDQLRWNLTRVCDERDGFQAEVAQLQQMLSRYEG